MTKSNDVKKFLKQFGLSPRVQSMNGQRNGVKVTHYIRAWANFIGMHGMKLNALEIIYGKDFKTNESATAGNVQDNYIAMSPKEWGQMITNHEANLSVK